MLSKCLIALQTLGSIFGKTGADGRKEIAIGPIGVLLCAGLTIGCSIQHTEPFSQCVHTVFSALGG